jgi:hypothetical protein
MLYLGHTALFQWKRESTTQLNGCKNSQWQQKEEWGSQVAGATLQADAAEVDVVDSAITMGADNNRTTDRGTTTTITSRMDLLHLDVTAALAALVATMAKVVVTENALDSLMALPGTKPSSAIRRAKHQCLSLKEICCLKIHVMFMNGHHRMIFKFAMQLLLELQAIVVALYPL